MNEFELVDIETSSDSPVMSLTTLLSKIYEEQISKITDDVFLNQKATRFILAVLSKQEAITQNDLVRVTHMKGSTISVTISKLEEKGMIFRKADNYDMRCVRVFLTEKGKELSEKRNNILKEIENKGKKNLTPKEIKEAVFVLETFLKNLLDNNN